MANNDTKETRDTAAQGDPRYATYAEEDVLLDPMQEGEEPEGASGASNTGAPYGQGYPPHTVEDHPEDEAVPQPEVYGAAALQTEPVAEPGAEPKVRATDKERANGKSAEQGR